MQLPRSAGILLHPTCLPGGQGIGDLGPEARTFVDRLELAGQSWWQVLPLNPPDYLGSPYASTSSMASNPTMIDLRQLTERGWLTDDEVAAIPSGDVHEFDVDRVTDAKDGALREAFARADVGDDDDFAAFCTEESAWLDEYALFAALRAAHGGDWRRWPDRFVERNDDALAEAREELSEEIEYVKFGQWIFDRQWQSLREYAAERGVKIIGDVPIFVAMDSADVWANRDIFKVDEHGEPDAVAGVPPDYFSETGQKWGNPVFRWDVLRDQGYAWWERRIARLLELCDVARIDHFRGFESYWEIPPDAPTAETGEWVEGPGAEFFEWVRERFDDVPFIAEDLGRMTEEVIALRESQNLPGMKILQFAFDGDPDDPFLPHTYPENCVAYTGTHDNDTTLGWWESIDEEHRHRVRTYLDHGDDGIVWAMIDALQTSDAALVVIPFQDVFELGNDARMNLPGTAGGNWTWRMSFEQLDATEPWERLGELVRLYAR